MYVESVLVPLGNYSPIGDHSGELVRAHIPYFLSTGRWKNVHALVPPRNYSPIGDDSGKIGEGQFCQLRERIILLSNI